MKITYNWLKEFVDFEHSSVQIAELLTMLGLEVESMEKRGEGMDDVVVALVEEKHQHPNADKLSLCRINNGSEVLDVVCGARNFNQGDTVALAKIGAVLPGDFKIKRSKIRGEESFGMLCSEKELGLADESDGIMLIPSGLASPGTPVFSALGLKDTLFEVGLTPNRADCLSALGIARELAAKLNKDVVYPSVSLSPGRLSVESVIGVSVEDQDYCPRYAARYISGCTIAPSPQWLVKRLKSIGIRSINNVVDVTNFVMMELGQPLHAFDCNRLAGSRIVVRRAEDGELFTTLDGNERVLASTDLVICDAERPVALAGVMGGQNSEIESSTTLILLESACFKPAAIRKTSKRLGLHTESSHRFERGIDIEGVTAALDRAAALIEELAGGTVANGIVDVRKTRLESEAIRFRPERANTLIGIRLPEEDIIDILRRLKCQISDNSDGSVSVVPPTYRIDIEREIDLIEEVARMNGFDKIPATMPIADVVSERPTRHQQLEKRVRDFLVNHGMNEVINFSFDAPDAPAKLMLSEDDIRRAKIKLTNPLVDEQSVMRTTLLPGILETTARNINFRSLDLKLFEIRRVYLPVPNEQMPREPIFIAGALTGLRKVEGWNQSGDSVDFYDVKGVVENLFEWLHIDGISWIPDNPEPYFHPGKSCTVFSGQDRIGVFGEIHPTVLENFGIEKPVFCFELDFEKLVKFSRTNLSITAPSKFPDSTRDIAMLIPESLQFEKIINCVKSARITEIEDITIFDVYRGKGIPEKYKSVAIRIRYRSYQRTLTDEQINFLHSKVTDGLVCKLQVTLR